MGPEKQKLEKTPVAVPHREDQTGMSQANQSLWDDDEGQILRPPPDAIPGKNLQQKQR